jgi:hypothetical protein
VDNAGFIVAAYVVTVTVVSVYTWGLARRLERARRAADPKRGGGNS